VKHRRVSDHGFHQNSASKVTQHLTNDKFV